MRITVLVLAGLVLAGCSPDEATSSSTVPTTVSSTSTSPESTTTTAGATTTRPSAATTTTTTAGTTTTVFDSNTLAEGSGCTPGPGDLPDGEWFGYWVAVEEAFIEFDLACWFSGEAAAIAAEEDGEESPPPNDYYVRNANPGTRDLMLSGGVTVIWYPEQGDPTSETTTDYTSWRNEMGSAEFSLGIWVTTRDGAVTAIREQWVP